MIYHRNLDGLRTVAVMLVIVSHWLGDTLVNRIFPLGFIGVNIFFVVSGFLITGILLKSKESIDHGDSIWRHLKLFIARRSLRIFPLYYSTLFFFIVLNLDNVRLNYWEYLIYIQNWMYYINDSMQGQLSPRWSLAVEEQFYLIWPLLILLIDKSYIRHLLVGFIGASILFKLILFFTYPDKTLLQFLTPSNFDSLSLGGLLACQKQLELPTLKKYLNLILVGLVLIIVHSYYRYSSNEFQLLPILSKSLGYSIISYCLVGSMISGRLYILFSNKLMVYLGRISYGLYIYHSMVFYIYAAMGFDLYQFSKSIRLSIAFASLIIISSISWHFFELPINRLKRKFNY